MRTENWRICNAKDLKVVLDYGEVALADNFINKSEIQCACLGTALNLPMTEATLLENGIMIIMSLMLLMEYIL